MKRFILLLPALMTSCGTLPEPFYGDPGTEGAKLGAPPAPVLYVPTPGGAMLGSAAPLYAKDLAAALASDDVPTVAGNGGPETWRVTTTASVAAGEVTPSYGIIGPGGKTYGAQAGTQLDAAAWSNGDPAALNAQAETDAVLLSKKLAVINETVQGANPNSLENRTPRVFFGSVTGAPGDGDNALALNMTRDLPSSATEMVANAASADFTVNGVVKTTPDKDQKLLLEIDWIVHDSSLRKVGQVTQLHELSAADIEPYWGDVAAAAASEGAAGVNEVIGNATLHKTAHGAAVTGTGYGGALAIPPAFLVPAPGAAAMRFAEVSPPPAAAPAVPAAAAVPAMLAAVPVTRPVRPALRVSVRIVPVMATPLAPPAPHVALAITAMRPKRRVAAAREVAAQPQPMRMRVTAAPAATPNIGIVTASPLLTTIAAVMTPAAYLIRPIPLATGQDLALFTRFGGWSPAPMTLPTAFGLPARPARRKAEIMRHHIAAFPVRQAAPAVLVETGAIIETAGDALER